MSVIQIRIKERAVQRKIKLDHKRAQAIRALMLETISGLVELESELRGNPARQYLTASHEALHEAMVQWNRSKGEVK